MNVRHLRTLSLSRWISVAAAILPLAVPGCATGPLRGAGPVEASRTLSLTVTLVAGDVEARAPGEGSFAKLVAGGGVAGTVADLRAARGGAVVLGSAADPRAEIWLRGGSEVRLGEDARGNFVVEVTRGEARARVFDDLRKLTVGAGKDARQVLADDVLVRVEDGAERVVPVAEDPGAAAFAREVESAAPPQPAGIGSLEVKTAEDKSARLGLRSVRASAVLAGDLAETRVEHVFHNDGADRLEGTFRFPLPEEASLVGLSMEIDGKMMDGELVEIDKARKTYESIVDGMRDPALLEWEHGSTFKLRVFPIEPKSDKRIVIRYVAPLRRDLGRYAYVYPTATPEMGATIPAFHLDLGGKTVVDEKDYRPTGEIAVPIPDADRPAEVIEERRPDGIYTAVHLRPSAAQWASVRPALPEAGAPSARTVVIVCDTSRSTLESRPLTLDALGAVLGELAPRDRFLVVAADVDQTDHAQGMVRASAAERAAALRFVEGIEPDGASDLGAALRHAGKRAAEARVADPQALVQVVYLGDGAPTWGDTDPAALHRIAAESLGETPLYALLLGSEVRADLFADLTALRGGFSARPRSPAAAHRFALQLAHAGETAAITHLTLDAGEGRSPAPLLEASLIEGDDVVALVRTPPGGIAPAEIELHGTVGARDVDLRLPVAAGSPQKHVARRWAALAIAALERQTDQAAKKDEIVKLSLDYQVMSKKTAFLVLESEEAYARYQIERKSKAKQQAEGKPMVTGGDLESLAHGARMGMDRIQPGDPEIHVTAPADASSVVVVFPFGETKIASFDPETRQWVVRFLIDAGTPDGTYRVSVRITHRDGRVELTSVPYVVDTLKPVVDVTVRATGTPVTMGAHAPGPPAQLEIHASQVIGDAEVQSALAPAERAGSSLAQLLRKYPDRLADVRRVEVRLEDGTVLPLDSLAPGQFGARWTPKEPLGGLGAGAPIAAGARIRLHVVAVDKALNQSVSDVDVALEGD